MSTQIYIKTFFGTSGPLPGLAHWYVRVSNCVGPERILLGSHPMLINEAPALAIIESLRVLDRETCGDVVIHVPDIPEMRNLAYPAGTSQAWQDAAQLIDEFEATLCAMSGTSLVGWLTGPVLAGRVKDRPKTGQNSPFGAF